MSYFTPISRWFGRRRRAQDVGQRIVEGTALKLNLLYDADRYRESSNMPWTFFAYPTSVAVAHGLPPDELACQFLGDVQASGIEVTIWACPFGNDTTYFGCKSHDRSRLHSVLNRLESSALYGRGFCGAHTLALMSLADGNEDEGGALCEPNGDRASGT